MSSSTSPIKLADHLVATFGDGAGQTVDVDGHPVIEMALVELYRETGTTATSTWPGGSSRPAATASSRNTTASPTYFSDQVPVREATTVEGHAVRAVYLAAGATDVALETADAELLEALKTQFEHMWSTKTYLTGGLGGRWEGEAFGDEYELPTDRAYAETCAAIGGIQWAWRMLLATGDAFYADAIERMLYNGFLAGVSLTGTEYFTVNPLQLRGGAADGGRGPAHGRRGWFDCAAARRTSCAPRQPRRLSRHHERRRRSDPPVRRGVLQIDKGELRIETNYPWDGAVRITSTASVAVEAGSRPGRRAQP